MGRLFAIALALTVAWSPAQADAQTLETHKARASGSPDALASTLPPALITSVTEGGTIFIAYAGLETPPSLVRLASDLFGPRATASLTANAPGNISLALAPARGGTIAQMMIHGSGAATPTLYHAVFGAAVPQDATVLLSETATTPCGGQVVLDRPLTPGAATRSYTKALRTRGFLVGQTTDADGTLILANGTPCSAIVFIQPDRTAPGRSTIVVRSLED